MSVPPNRIAKYLDQQPDGDERFPYPSPPMPMPAPLMPPPIAHPPQQLPPQFTPGAPLMPFQPHFFAPPPVAPPQAYQPPELQAAPPDQHPPPPYGGDGGGGDGGDWSFPPSPPMGRGKLANPFVTRHVTTAMVENPMYVVATVPFYGENEIALCSNAGNPPPICIAYWVFPVSYVEIQVRQYFHPPGPFATVPDNAAGWPDHDEATFRKMGWLASPATTHRWPVFQYDPAGQMVNFDASILDTPYSDWRLGTVDRYVQLIGDVVDKLAEDSRKMWLHPPWLKGMPMMYAPFTGLPSLYSQALEYGSPLVCATPGWENIDE